MLKTNETARSVSVLTFGISAAILLCSITAGAAVVFTEQSCKKAKLTAAEVRAACIIEAQKASADLVLSADAKAKCESNFDARIQILNKLAASANIACRSINNDDGTISDLDTLLIWQRRSVSDGFPITYTWTEATTSFLDALNQPQDAHCSKPDLCVEPGFAGHRDWRLPSLRELKSASDGGGNTTLPLPDEVETNESLGNLNPLTNYIAITSQLSGTYTYDLDYFFISTDRLDNTNDFIWVLHAKRVEGDDYFSTVAEPAAVSQQGFAIGVRGGR